MTHYRQIQAAVFSSSLTLLHVKWQWQEHDVDVFLLSSGILGKILSSGVHRLKGRGGGVSLQIMDDTGCSRVLCKRGRVSTLGRSIPVRNFIENLSSKGYLRPSPTVTWFHTWKKNKRTVVFPSLGSFNSPQNSPIIWIKMVDLLTFSIDLVIHT